MANKIILKDLVNLFVKRIYIVIIAIIAFSVVGYFWSKYTYQPVYSSESSFVAYHKNAKKRDSDLSFMTTYEKVLTDPIILQDVQSKMKKVQGYDGNLGTISNSLETSVEPGTVIIKVVAHADSPRVSVAIVNNTIKSFRQNASKIISVGTVNQLAKARLSKVQKNSADTKKFIVLGSMFGLAISILGILILDRKKYLN